MNVVKIYRAYVTLVSMPKSGGEKVGTRCLVVYRSPWRSGSVRNVKDAHDLALVHIEETLPAALYDNQVVQVEVVKWESGLKPHAVPSARTQRVVLAVSETCALRFPDELVSA